MDIYKRLLGYVKPFQGRLVIAIIFMFLFSVANSLAALMAGVAS